MEPLPWRAIVPPPQAQPVLDYHGPSEPRRDRAMERGIRLRAALRGVGRALVVITAVSVGFYLYTLAVALMSS